ncbi:soluble lamin-associated protein of 75 kDa-like isoform X2 [Polistes fuscatus]|uniref:soluble lamin-associated protein of 75 kDa-like isoform X2 n=1 Tax=Polistes fuscatus TaxID=30207 RepID=UPI001CA88D12|nr:soluble lamin-associated protein of 75 kDa-like isoform X2 [Polistes fuscatus]
MDYANYYWCTNYEQKTELPRIIQTQLDLKQYNIQGTIYRLDCNKCNQFVAIKVNDNILDINNSFQDKYENNWNEVKTNQERLIYYILCRIIYVELDTPKPEKLETPYDYADNFDIVLIRWENGIPIGFYTVKPKGTEVYSTNERYTMPVLDTAYIRSKYRNKGFGTEILFDMIKRFPNEDIGFSKPISDNMLKVLQKFLRNYKEYRLRFWEIADWDIYDSQKLIWFGVRDKLL